jgi:hypothetical protein
VGRACATGRGRARRQDAARRAPQRAHPRPLFGALGRGPGRRRGPLRPRPLGARAAQRAAQRRGAAPEDRAVRAWWDSARGAHTQRARGGGRGLRRPAARRPATRVLPRGEGRFAARARFGAACPRPRARALERPRSAGDAAAGDDPRSPRARGGAPRRRGAAGGSGGQPPGGGVDPVPRALRGTKRPQTCGDHRTRWGQLGLHRASLRRVRGQPRAHQPALALEFAAPGRQGDRVRPAGARHARGAQGRRRATRREGGGRRRPEGAPRRRLRGDARRRARPTRTRRASPKRTPPCLPRAIRRSPRRAQKVRRILRSPTPERHRRDRADPVATAPPPC